MTNKFHNIKVYQIITLLSLIIIALIISFIPLHRANNIKNALYRARYNQIKYLNEQSPIIPQTINIIKGHIIHNEKALKDIVYINMLTKTKSSNIKEIYENQIKLFSITKGLIDNANKNSLLSNNENFKKIKARFDEIYSTMTTELNLCRIRTKHLQKYINLPIYKNMIDTTNINDIICID
ncbi:MAG: hypothetical protein IJ638_02770 [Alphaproteobacteria bacterium]|nr:hypothetical protein [Alphaproteobacteria bacterium]